MDLDRMREIVAAIPPGAWMSYGDVAAAAGGSDVHARTLNQRFIREELPGAHRVLKSDWTFLYSGSWSSVSSDGCQGTGPGMSAAIGTAALSVAGWMFTAPQDTEI